MSDKKPDPFVDAIIAAALAPPCAVATLGALSE